MKLPTALIALLLLTIAVAQEATPAESDTGALDSSAAEGVDPITVPVPRPTIYGYISGNDQYQILRAVVDALPNTSITLDEPGARLTLCAPNDAAMRGLARQVSGDQDPPEIEGVIAQIVEGVNNIKKGPGFTDVRGIIFYHLINRHYTFAELEEIGSVASSQGKNLTFLNGMVRDADESRPDANAFEKNIFTQNGWIHAIDAVLLPFNLQRAIDISRPSPSPVGSPDPSETASTTDDPNPIPTDPVIIPGPGETVEPSVSEEVDVSSSPEEEDDGVCFPSTARVHTPHGSVPMEKLEAGQEVLHHESGKSSVVFLFTHRINAHKGWFYRISTSSGHSVTMTGNHYLYANDRLTAADAVVIGDALRTVSGISPVVKVERVKGTGLYAPHSVHGDLVVDGIVVSGYSRVVRPGVAHAILAPIRWLVKVTGVKEPFGGILYEGGRGIEKFLPRGKAKY